MDLVLKWIFNDLLRWTLYYGEGILVEVLLLGECNSNPYKRLIIMVIPWYIHIPVFPLNAAAGCVIVFLCMTWPSSSLNKSLAVFYVATGCLTKVDPPPIVPDSAVNPGTKVRVPDFRKGLVLGNLRGLTLARHPVCRMAAVMLPVHELPQNMDKKLIIIIRCFFKIVRRDCSLPGG